MIYPAKVMKISAVLGTILFRRLPITIRCHASISTNHRAKGLEMGTRDYVPRAG